jgi:small subunit ribosomal protein S3
MAQKTNPKILRISKMEDWDSRGFYEKNFAKFLEEDYKIREYIFGKFGKAGIERVTIDRFPGQINITIHTARPGVIIGRKGEGVEKLVQEIKKKIVGENIGVKIDIKEVKNFWLSAPLVAQWMAEQIEKRVPYRRVLKAALARILAQKEAKGARVYVAGRLDGVEIARKEWLQKGQMPRQTLRSDIDYAEARAYCTYGVIGIKVWIYKGEKA